MAITFSIPNTEIIMTTGQTNVKVQDLVNEIRLFESTFQMMGLDYIIDAEGKAPLGDPGVFTEIVMTLRNPWTLRFEDEGAAHVSVSGGTTLAADALGDPRPVSTNFSLTISQSVSGTLLEGVLSDVEREALAEKFWEVLVPVSPDAPVVGSYGEFVARKLLSVAKYLGLR